jgi:hypothetical protein
MSFLELFTRDRPSALRILETAEDANTLVNQHYKSGWSCVHQAVQDGDLHALAKLIEHKVNLWTAYDWEIYPIQIAIRELRYEALSLILTSEIPQAFVKLIHNHANNSFCDFKSSFRKSFFHLSLQTNNEHIVGLIINKFLPYLSVFQVTEFVQTALRYSSFNIIKNIFGEIEVTNSTLRKSLCARTVLSRQDADIDIIDYILNIGDTEYPFYIGHYRFLDLLVRTDRDRKIVECLLRHKDKVSFDNAEVLLYHAITLRNQKFVDVALAIGCDPFRSDILPLSVSCLSRSFEECTKNNNPENALILRKLLLYKGIDDRTYASHATQDNYNEEISEHKRVCINIVIDFYRSVTLFEYLDYNLRIRDLANKYGVVPQ